MAAGLVLAGEEGADPHLVRPLPARSPGGSAKGPQEPPLPHHKGNGGYEVWKGCRGGSRNQVMGEMAWPPPRGNCPYLWSSPSHFRGRERSWGCWVCRSQPRINSGCEQSAAKSLLPGIQHQPPALQKGPSGGRSCCCSMTLRGPRSRLLPSTTGNGWATRLSTG